ncbi:hypothetical protein EMCRGX_G029740 [Ephydatia muelleri]
MYCGMLFSSPPSGMLNKDYASFPGVSPSSTEYRLYRWRWLIMVALLLLNVSSGMMFITYSPIPNDTALFYGVPESYVNGFSITYSATTFFIGLISIMILDTCGLKISLYFGATCNLIGGVIRWISTISPVLCSHDYQRSGYMVAMIASILLVWSQGEGHFCTSITSIGNPVGIAIAYLLSPHIVESNGLPTLLWIYVIPAAVAFLLTIIAFRKSKPDTPPAPSANVEEDSVLCFFHGLRQILGSCSFWGLMLVWGIGAGLFNAMITILPQMLCSYGYSDVSLWVTLMIFSGVAGATIVSFTLDYTKKYKEVGVVCLGLSVLCFIWFSQVSRLYDQSVNVVISLCVFGFFALPLVPVCMELGVEITYPVGEATSSGLLWSSVQVFAVVFIALSTAFESPLSQELISNSKCSHAQVQNALYCNTSIFDIIEDTPQDMTNVVYCVDTHQNHPDFAVKLSWTTFPRTVALGKLVLWTAPKPYG